MKILTLTKSLKFPAGQMATLAYRRYEIIKLKFVIVHLLSVMVLKYRQKSAELS